MAENFAWLDTMVSPNSPFSHIQVQLVRGSSPSLQVVRSTVQECIAKTLELFRDLSQWTRSSCPPTLDPFSDTTDAAQQAAAEVGRFVRHDFPTLVACLTLSEKSREDASFVFRMAIEDWIPFVGAVLKCEYATTHDAVAVLSVVSALLFRSSNVRARYRRSSEQEGGATEPQFLVPGAHEKWGIHDVDLVDAFAAAGGIDAFFQRLVALPNNLQKMMLMNTDVLHWIPLLRDDRLLPFWEWFVANALPAIAAEEETKDDEAPLGDNVLLSDPVVRWLQNWIVARARAMLSTWMALHAHTEGSGAFGESESLTIPACEISPADWMFCGVCRVSHAEMPLVDTDCHHVFCAPCFQRIRRRACPTCRTSNTRLLGEKAVPVVVPSFTFSSSPSSSRGSDNSDDDENERSGEREPRSPASSSNKRRRAMEKGDPTPKSAPRGPTAFLRFLQEFARWTCPHCGKEEMFALRAYHLATLGCGAPKCPACGDSVHVVSSTDNRGRWQQQRQHSCPAGKAVPWALAKIRADVEAERAAREKRREELKRLKLERQQKELAECKLALETILKKNAEFKDDQAKIQAEMAQTQLVLENPRDTEDARQAGETLVRLLDRGETCLRESQQLQREACQTQERIRVLMRELGIPDEQGEGDAHAATGGTAAAATTSKSGEEQAGGGDGPAAAVAAAAAVASE